MTSYNSRNGSGVGTRKGKATFVGGIIVVVVAVVIIIPLSFSAYQDNLRVQQGDKVDLMYLCTYASNDTFFYGNNVMDHIIGGSNDLLPYLDQRLVGMKPGVDEDILIPAMYGVTDSHDPRYGHDVLYHVTIVTLTRWGMVLYNASWYH